jgi:hypothetical protein
MVSRRRPGTATRLMAGSVWGIAALLGLCPTLPNLTDIVKPC